MIGAIAGSIDLRVVGLAELVDQNAVVDFQAGIHRQFHVGYESNADHHEISRHAASANAQNGGNRVT
ncbi:hypothetical protein D3C78_1841780 [compost metagenome]